MQTFRLISTIKWIESQFSKEVVDLIFDLGLVNLPPASQQAARGGIKASNELALFGDRATGNPDAIAVLNAFGLADLATRKFAEGIAVMAASVSKEPPAHPESPLMQALRPLTSAWRIMTRCVDPISRLTMPTELREANPPKSLTSLEMYYADGDGIDPQTLSRAIELIDTLYSGVAEVYQAGGAPQLKIIKIESGSSIRIDCKGLGDVAKHFKEFLLQAWQKLRYQKAEEVALNSGAVLASLDVLKELHKREQDGDLSPEKAELLRRGIVDSTVGLFHRGVLPAQVSNTEVVNNVGLLGHFNPKLLTDGSAPKTQPSEEAKPSRKRKKRPKPSDRSDGPEE